MQMEKICESIESKVPTDDNTYVGEDGLLYAANAIQPDRSGFLH